MAVDPIEKFDRDDLTLSPEMHRAQAEMAAERGEEYDPHEREREMAERSEDWPDLDEAEPVEGQEQRHEEWLNAGE